VRDIAVVVPVFNSVRFIGEALASLFAQTVPPREIIVVDNGSTDGTLSALAGVGDRITVVTESVRGASAARNAGLRRTRCELVAFLDADDISLPRRLERQAAVLADDDEAALVYCPVEYVEEDGRPTGRTFDCSDYRRHGFRGLLFLRNRIPTTSAVMARRAALLEAGGFDEAISHNEEYDLWLRVTGLHAVACVDETLAQYRLHGRNISHDSAAQRDNTRKALAKHDDASIRRELTAAFDDPRRAEWAFGCVLFNMARFEDALRVFGGVAMGSAVDADVEFMRGNTLAALDRSTDAASAFTHALSMDPSHAAAANNLGVILGRGGRRAEARRSFERAAALNSQYDDPRSNLAALDHSGSTATLSATVAPLRKVLKPAPRIAAPASRGCDAR
jgi:glycosyltransferase involved in cell wall biosynthesis